MILKKIIGLKTEDEKKAILITDAVLEPEFS
jgi:hypothetical protein